MQFASLRIAVKPTTFFVLFWQSFVKAAYVSFVPTFDNTNFNPSGDLP
jgi:hypothetical protein